ncbi:unnamed protein product, partial [Allacma fusca]
MITVMNVVIWTLAVLLG